MPSSSDQCGYCSSKIESQYNYCHQCGHIIKCPKCYGECDNSFNFCPHCGIPLREERIRPGQLENGIKRLQLTSATTSPHTVRQDSANPDKPSMFSTSLLPPFSQTQPPPRIENNQLISTCVKESDRSEGKDMRQTPVLENLFGSANPAGQQSKAKATCAVGAYTQTPKVSFNMNQNAQNSEKKNTAKQRMTSVLKSYSVIVSKLHGEADFQQPVHSRMLVYVTHVEEDGYFFWGQVLSDKRRGNRTNIETLERISRELQSKDSRVGEIKTLGRCAALEDGLWYRAWNRGLNSDGKHDILYVDYGNTAFLPPSEVALAAIHIWNLPPMAKPFRLIDSGRGVTMKECLNKKVTLEIISAGVLQSNFVASVYLLPEEMQ